jgi:hypothetical protein
MAVKQSLVLSLIVSQFLLIFSNSIWVYIYSGLNLEHHDDHSYLYREWTANRQNLWNLSVRIIGFVHSPPRKQQLGHSPIVHSMPPIIAASLVLSSLDSRSMPFVDSNILITASFPFHAADNSCVSPLELLSKEGECILRWTPELSEQHMIIVVQEMTNRGETPAV